MEIGREGGKGGGEVAKERGTEGGRMDVYAHMHATARVRDHCPSVRSLESY